MSICAELLGQTDTVTSKGDYALCDYALCVCDYGYLNTPNPAPALAPMPTLGPTAASTAEADRAALHTTASGVPNEHVSRLRQ